jgi:hypothetical protein
MFNRFALEGQVVNRTKMETPERYFHGVGVHWWRT